MKGRVGRQEECRGRRWIGWRFLFCERYYPLLWMVLLLLLYAVATLVRPHLPDHGVVYCYVWTDYCLRR